jgi:hypothetical protein
MIPIVTEIMIVLVTGSSPKRKNYVLEGNLPFES